MEADWLRDGCLWVGYCNIIDLNGTHVDIIIEGRAWLWLAFGGKFREAYINDKSNKSQMGLL